MNKNSKHSKIFLLFSTLGILLSLMLMSAAAPPANAQRGATDILADFEGLAGPPEFFVFFGGSSVTTTPVTVAAADPLARPGQSAANDVLQVDYNVTDFGGFGQAFEVAGAQDWSNYTSFDFWFYGTGSGLSYQAEISDNRSNPGVDTSERFDYTFTDTTPGWQYISIPFTDFTRATDFQPGGAPNDGFTLTEIWAWAIVLPNGADTVYFDDVSLGRRVIDDFESGLPAGTDANGVPVGFYTFNGAGSGVAISTAATPPAPVLPATGEPNNVLQIDIDSTSFAGFIHGFENSTADTWVSQDWTKYKGFSFWFYGQNSGSSLFIDLLESRNPGSTTDDAERWTVAFADDFSGWQKLEFPFSAFTRKEIGNGAPNNGLTLDTVHGWAFGALGTGGPRTYYMDNVTLYGVGEVPPLSVSFALNRNDIEEGTAGNVAVKLNRPMTADDPAQVTVDYATEAAASIAIEGREYTPAAGTLTFTNGGPVEQSFSIQTFDDTKYEGDERIVLRLSNPVGAEPGFITQASAFIVDNDPFDRYLLDDFERGAYLWNTANDEIALSATEIAAGDVLARPGQDPVESVLSVTKTDDDNKQKDKHKAKNKDKDKKKDKKKDKIDFGRDFAIGQDWTRGQALSFWMYGTNSDEEITVVLKENRAPDPGPAGWNLVWSDEFNEPAGTPPNPANWSYEIGDVTPDGKNGWGNEELQYYTSNPANAATDGNGNLALTLQAADGSQQCYYGPCEYTSARLISWHKAEFAYGRIESRIKVPQGAGIWPAFWSLGTDIDRNPWPGTGEIDFMEFVGRLPNEIFGTIHGPGYAGGASFGGIYDFGGPVYSNYHTFTIEWEPNLIRWYVDGILYHTATPADVSPNEWVFNDPVFLLLNVAVGGNFGGTVGPDMIPPQSMLVDYVRVYQGPDTAERWEAKFTDNFSGWQQVVIPFDTLKRSKDKHQPAGAPNDGLTLDEVWGYGFEVEPEDDSGPLLFDQFRLEPAPPPTQITVTSLGDNGPGSLRQALADIAIGGTISFDPALAGGTINLTSGPLVPANTVTIDGSGAPGLSISGGGVGRVLIVDPGINVNLGNLTVTNGYGFQLAGGILNNGVLTLNQVVVTGNSMTTDAGDFWQGGAGIYNGDGATLNLIDSTVSNNNSGWAGGGIFSFFNTTTLIERSTISGNTAADVGGGLRTLGNVTVLNSTISGNAATGWHGGGAFVTDGVMDVTNSTITNNSGGPGGTAGGLFVGTFGPSSATLNLQNSIVANNADFGCFLAPFGAGPVALNSLGGNVFTDATCNPGPTDQVVVDAGVGPLADNGGPTQTHALTAGSPAIDTADPLVCLATDQRGIARPQRTGCDAGAFELQ